MERENDLRKNEIRSLEERQQKDNQVKLHVWVTRSIPYKRCTKILSSIFLGSKISIPYLRLG